MVKIIREDDVVSEPSLSCGGTKLSYRFGHCTQHQGNLPQQNVDEPAHQSANLIMGQEPTDIPPSGKLNHRLSAGFTRMEISLRPSEWGNLG
jgi:hypothetical protein